MEKKQNHIIPIIPLHPPPPQKKKKTAGLFFVVWGRLKISKSSKAMYLAKLSYITNLGPDPEIAGVPFPYLLVGPKTGPLVFLVAKKNWPD